MTDPTATDQQIQDMIDANLAIDPTDQNETNLKTINDIYLNNFAQGIYTLSDDDLAAITAIAQQCYVTGGPSVFQARSMYWIATGTTDLAFQDECVANTGSFRTRNPISNTSIYTFKVYPNPIGNDGQAHITSPDNGVMTLYDLQGQVVDRQPLVTGSDNIISIKNTTSSLLIYEVILADGKTIKGKLSNHN